LIGYLLPLTLSNPWEGELLLPSPTGSRGAFSTPLLPLAGEGAGERVK